MDLAAMQGPAGLEVDVGWGFSLFPFVYGVFFDSPTISRQGDGST